MTHVEPDRKRENMMTLIEMKIVNLPIVYSLGKGGEKVPPIYTPIINHDDNPLSVGGLVPCVKRNFF